jgi:hypothetical protein
VEELLDRKDELVPLLASLTIWFEDDHQERYRDGCFDRELDGLRCQCKSAGVELLSYCDKVYGSFDYANFYDY